MPPRRRCELLLFAACFLAFAYFNQGGGWNQNARFAEVRAVVEEGRFAIDDYLVYQRDPAGGDLVRCPVTRAEYDWDGTRNRLCWVDMEWTFFPVGDHPLEPGVKKVAMVEKCSSGDLAYVPEKGEFHPNKPPGTSFLALPGYFVLYHVERWLGINPDRWWTLDVNAWLTGVFSVGLISALGCVLFFRLAADFSGGNLPAALGATVVLAFGTTFFPFGTLFFDHDLTASFLVAAFYFLRVRPARSGNEFWAGLCGGLAVLTNYVAVAGVAVLGLYALLREPARRVNWRAGIGYALGGAGCFVLLCWYGWACYGSPLRPGTDFQNPLFRDPDLFLGMFSIPHSSDDFWRLLYLVQMLAFSPFRGVFWFSPVLLLGICGMLVWLRERKLAAEARVCLAVFACFFGVNTLFNGWHAGFAAGPRYLVPALPFLALPLVVAFMRWRWFAGILATYSIVINLLLTATDAQNPVGVGGHARVENHKEWTYDLLREYAWPLFVSGRAWPLLQRQIEVELDKEEAPMDDAGQNAAERKAHRELARLELMEGIDRGNASPLMLGSIVGPVSVNPIGAFEGLLNYEFFPPGSEQTRWASFNVGELLWPESRWSLLPLLLLSGGACGLAWRIARRG